MRGDSSTVLRSRVRTAMTHYHTAGHECSESPGRGVKESRDAAAVTS